MATTPWELVRRGRHSGYVERTAGAVVRRELPGPRIAMIVELGPPLRLTNPAVDGARFAGGFVAGLCDFPTVTAHDGFQAGVQVDLSPLEARELFGVPMSELAGRCVGLAELLPRGLRSLPERLAELPTHQARFALLDQVLPVVRGARSVPARAAAWACARIGRAGGAVDVRGLARELGYSEKQVGRIFREHVGMTPKLYARLVRFGALVDRLLRDRTAGWGELAVELGFYDQPHLVREVRQFAGATPTELRADVDSIQDLMAGDGSAWTHEAR